MALYARASSDPMAAVRGRCFVERRDRDEVLEMVRRDGYALEFAAAELRADRAIVLEAVKQDGSALEFAAAELRADREIVFEAVRHYGSALRFAAEELRADHEIVPEAVEQLEAVKKNALAAPAVWLLIITAACWLVDICRLQWCAEPSLVVEP